VNNRSAAKLSNIPNVWETSLDMTLIEQLSQFAAPFRFPSDWIVRLDTYYLGGGRYWGRWEIADLGILVVFRKRGAILRSKVALLQSKRLYPDETETAQEDIEMDYRVGFGSLFESESHYKSQVKPRTFQFTPQSRYRALEYMGEQYAAILQYTADHQIPVYYLLYNPLDVPHAMAVPAMATSTGSHSAAIVGCRVVSANAMDAKLGARSLRKSENPTYAQLLGANPHAPDADCWALPDFVADQVLGCREGYIAGKNPFEDEGLFRIFNLRGGPISAAILITIDAPGEA
jgi:hypothetical protein